MRDLLIKKPQQEVRIKFRGENYLVRPNGEIFRECRKGKKRRPLDNTWTFGKPSSRDGYMRISHVAVHQIVATAYHGERPSSDHVVDHIDTNRKNNRPENLRWVTRLENIQDNPKTYKRIFNKWGSIESLLKDPNPSKKADPLSNRPWMIHEEVEETSIVSLTPLALQRYWKIPSEFPRCPEKITKNPLYDYGSNLECGCVFSKNDIWQSIVDTYELSEDGKSLSVLCKIDGGVKDWAVAEVVIESGKFVHISHHAYFKYNGAMKEHYKILGRPWDGGWTFDDFC